MACSFTRPPPTLAQRAAELRALPFEGAQLKFFSGRSLHYRFHIAPSEFGRLYECELRLTPDTYSPEMYVLSPDLKVLAGDSPLPHVYPSKRAGTRLCLWLPKEREWQSQMSLTDTYIAWTSEWLWYFENWLATGMWEGGGEHPQTREKRWGSRK
ncbi:hypothetical protein CUZ56_01209 [Saezia sanguinis]|uniref:Type II CBASS E2 protein domain-containing protein n=1 Tax=Saezia sanguinis TaxID=1965230 RepID=A0A433SEZ3_9BURK|nr:hypothetical protein [Saezia sanguinis]RUS67266.1 hypothetical protein CUZ56_01209 [Saezia sanguinis]